MATNQSATPSGNGPLHPESIPAELKAIPRWLLWKLEHRNGKPTKTPYQVSGSLAKVNDSSTWIDFATALAAYQAGGFSGIGIVLTDDDDLVGIDLDQCLNPDTGELDPDAARIINDLPSYCEVSPSGRGLRLFGFGTLPQGGRRKGHVEMYASGRYLTVTGQRFNGHAALAHITPELATVHARIFAQPEPVDAKAKPADPPNLDDAELLDKARRARNGAEFDRLWSGDTSGQGNDHSSADLALCNLLAFWTGNDPARIDRLFRQSVLFRPKKWDEAHSADGRTYGQMTVDKAIAGNRETYSGRSQSSPIDEEVAWRCGVGEREPGCDDDRGEAPEPAPANEPANSFVWIDEFCSQPTESSWLVRGYFERDSLAAIFGDSEAGKSFVAIDLTCHVAHGMKWRGRKVTQGIVLYIAGEGQNGLRRRFKAWHERHGIPLKNIAVRTIPSALCEPASVDALIEHISQLLAGMDQKPVLIVIDTLNRNFGGGDENSTKDMTAFVTGATRLRLATGACVLVIHHCGHADKTRMRSAIALHNAVDAEYLVARTGSRDDLKTLVTTMTTVRGKDNGDGAPLSWAWSLQSLPWTELDDDGNVVSLASVVLEPTDAAEDAPSLRLTRAQSIVLQALQAEGEKNSDGWVFIADWRRESLHLGVSLAGGKAAKYNAFNRAVESLYDAKIVDNDGEKWRATKDIRQKSTKSTNSLHVENVDSGQGRGGKSTKSTHPLKGCRHVDSPQAYESQNGTKPCPDTPAPVEPMGSSSLPARILATLRAAYPARVALADIVRAVDTGKGASPAVVSVMLMRLAKAGEAAKENDRWVAIPGEARS